MVMKRKFKKSLIGNTNAEKPIRRVELGWLHCDRKVKQYKQVRAKTGGGTRHLTVPKSFTMQELKEMGSSLFFPEGISLRGPLDNFVTSIRDFQEKEVDGSIDIESMYEKTKMRILRFYFCTKEKEVDSDEELPHYIINAEETINTEHACTCKHNYWKPYTNKYKLFWPYAESVYCQDHD